MWMKHFQGQFLKQPASQPETDGFPLFLPAEMPTHCPGLCPLPTFISNPVRAPQQAPPPSPALHMALLLTHTSLPHAGIAPSKCRTPGTAGYRRRMCLNYRCVRWQRALMSFSSCVPGRKHRQIAGAGRREERWRTSFPRVCLQYTGLQRGCMSTRTSGCHTLPSPPLP